MRLLSQFNAADHAAAFQHADDEYQRKLREAEAGLDAHLSARVAQLNADSDRREVRHILRMERLGQGRPSAAMQVDSDSDPMRGAAASAGHRARIISRVADAQWKRKWGSTR